MTSDLTSTRALDPAAVRYGPDGLVAAVVQDAADGRVLMVAWQDAEAIEATLRTGEVHFHSRSRGTLWRKGETSGNTLAVESMQLDCDADAVLISARPAGPTCHTGARSCFDETPAGGAVEAPEVAGAADAPEVAGAADAPEVAGAADAPEVAGAADAHDATRRPSDVAVQDFAWLERLWATIDDRARHRPAGSYTTTLLDGGVDAVARKVAEEANEVVMAAKDDDAAQQAEAPRLPEPLAGELADLLFHALVLCAERGITPSRAIDILKERHSR